ncbi:MAG: TVP38/TMEM64 family protein [Desulfobacteraceae bacterium]|nr:TVP38/TMEM64 family protein [Desulfobacteraceae bacterium]
MKIPDTKKLAVIGVIVVIVVLFFVLNLQQYMNLAYIKESRENFQALLARYPALVTGAFFIVYIVVTALSLPGAAVMTLAGGALFGFWTGLVIVSFASSIGATLACAVARYLFRDWTRQKMGAWYDKINAGIKKEGAFYLFTLRLIPAVPFFAINLGMALTEMRLWTFYWVSQAGMLAGTAVFINAGNQLGQISKMGDILSPSLIISFVILGIFPLAVKKTVNLIRAKTGKGKIGPER